MQRVVLIVTVILAAILGLYVAVNFADRSGQNVKNTENGDAAVLIGGPFSLVNHKGEAVSAETYKGKDLLVYFGFTYCPDVCPTELQKISAALDTLSAKERAGLVPLFITVDPERDDVAQMASYVSNFHPDIIGLTGSEEQIKAAASAYRIYRQKVEDESSTAAYTMDHSNLIYLMDGNNHYIAHFTARSSVDEIAAKLKARL